MNASFPPIPASPFLISHLLGLVFVLHIIFFNYLIAAPVLASWYHLRRPENGRLFAEWLARALPVAFTFAINFGVASLLFMQVLYPERFFTANILLGKAWLAIIGLLMIAFYMSYVSLRLISNTRRNSLWGGLSSMLVSLLVLCIAVLMVSNYFLTTNQSLWLSLQGKPWMALQNLSFVPRILHFVIGSFAVTGFWMVWISWWRQRRGGPAAELAEFRKLGLYVATGATGLQIIVGVWFLIWLPSEAWDRLFSGTFPSLVWIIGVACGLVMLGLLIVAIGSPEKKFWQRTATLLLLCTIGGMVGGRDALREVSFDPTFHITDLPSAPQTGPILMFTLILIGGALTILWLIWQVWRIPATPSE